MKKIARLFVLISQMGFGQKEKEVVADITDVTVYTAAAEISYEKEVLVPKGRSAIVFTELSPFIVANSVNVSVAGVNIITISDRINYTRVRRSVNELVN